jgi:pre-mRNA-splicing factor CWC22
MVLTEDDTTANSRIFIKILMQEIANNMGMKVFVAKMDEVQPESLFPTDSVENCRFSINFFTSIGLGAVTEKMREFLKNAPKLLLEKKYQEMLALAKKASASSDSDSDSSSDDSGSKSSHSTD